MTTYGTITPAQLQSLTGLELINAMIAGDLPEKIASSLLHGQRGDAKKLGHLAHVLGRVALNRGHVLIFDGVGTGAWR